MPKHIYKRGDAAFYKWWEHIYQKEMDLFETMKTGCATTYDMREWEKLKAYYHGLCDGRKRTNEGPL